MSIRQDDLKIGTCISYKTSNGNYKDGVIYRIIENNSKDKYYEILWHEETEDGFAMTTRTYFEEFFKKCQLSVIPYFCAMHFLGDALKKYEDKNEEINFLAIQEAFSGDTDITSYLYFKRKDLFIEIGVPEATLFINNNSGLIPYVYIFETHDINKLHLNKNGSYEIPSVNKLTVKNINGETSDTYSNLSVPRKGLKVYGCAFMEKDEPTMLLFNYSADNSILYNGISCKESLFTEIKYKDLIQELKKA